MIIEEKINDLIFVEQRTYYIYKTEEDRSNDKPVFTTSKEIVFEAFKKENLKIQELKRKCT